MGYRQLSEGERYAIARMRRLGYSMRRIAEVLDRSASTVSREIRRNATRHGGKYRAEKAHQYAVARRRRSRRNRRYGERDWARVGRLLQRKWSAGQIVGWHRRHGLSTMSKETIYRYLKADRRQGGQLWRHCRVLSKYGRKRRGSPATRGKMVGKRHISERPLVVQRRRVRGHWEGDTVMGADGRHCVLTLVERVSGYVVIKKLSARTKEQACQAMIQAIRELPGRVKTITLDNGTEFHDYKLVEQATGIKIYFATPYHSWERAINENTNGLIRQYLPKGECLKHLRQRECDQIAHELNTRPRERLAFRTPSEVLFARSHRCCT